MKKIYLPLLSTCLFIMTFFVFANTNAGSKATVKGINTVDSTFEPKIENTVTEAENVESIAKTLYSTMNLKSIGLSQDAFSYAYQGYQNLLEKGKLPKSNILTVVDFSQSSDNKRMYIIDLKDQRVLVNTFVAHGKNTGLKYAENFSNIHESLQSSLGFYVTTNTYSGKHGLSLRLSGVDGIYNSNAEDRAIVVHGADYIGEHRVGSAYQGRSFGCPAVPRDIAPKVIDIIKEGTCLFIYKPNQRYLHGSKVLNG